MKSDYDAITIGAGPAGSEFAYQLAKLGYRVLVLEKKALDREKPCGGGIQVQELVEFGNPPSETIERKITQAAIVASDAGVLSLDLSTDGRYGITVKRSLYDRYLQKRAEEAGAVILAHQNILDVRFSSEAVEVAAEHDGRISQYRGGLLAHAGGFNCQPLDRILGIKRPNSCDLVITYQLWFKLPEEEISQRLGSTVQFFFDEEFLPRGYIWAFPKRDVIAVGLGTTYEVIISRKLKLRRQLLTFIQKSPVLSEQLKGGEIVRADGGCIPLSVQPKLAIRNAILLGDAGGFGNIIHGGGIYQARKSALIAREYIDLYLKSGDREYLRQFDNAARTHFYEYETKWDKRLRPFLQKSSLVNHLIRASQDGDGEIEEALSRKDTFYNENERIFREARCAVLVVKGGEEIEKMYEGVKGKYPELSFRN